LVQKNSQVKSTITQDGSSLINVIFYLHDPLNRIFHQNEDYLRFHKENRTGFSDLQIYLVARQQHNGMPDMSSKVVTRFSFG
jgi:hypothetical protein